jgi:tape measure domain-containing protein
MVAKISQRTGKLFTNDEAILFAENLNKMYKIAGASNEEMHSSQLQLMQALGSGVLRGEEFNAVYEAAPNIMHQVAESMGVPIEKLREMAADGKITASIVKNAMLNLKEETLGEFDNMPMTWADVWTGVMNRLYMASIPLLQAISWLAQNWSILEPIVVGISAALLVYLAATKGVELATKAWAAAQAFLNGVMALNPIFLIIMGVILLIAIFYAGIAVINKFTKKSLSATGMIVGALATAVAFIWNLFLGLLDIVLAVVNWMWNKWAAFANFFANLFNDPIASIIHLFGDMADNVLGILENIAKGIDKVFGSNLAGAVQGWRSGLDSMVENAANKYGNGTYEKVMDEINLSSESLGLKRWAYGDAYNSGYSWGDKAGGAIADALDTSSLAGDVATTAENTGKSADSLEITSEELKYLRDIAERDTVNRFTTAEIKVDMTNNNNINKDMDLDGIVDYLVVGVNEAMEKAAEGVYA